VNKFKIMELVIVPEMHLYEIAELVRVHFPYLDVLFFDEDHTEKEKVNKQNIIDKQQSIREVRPHFNECSILLKNDLSVRDFEEQFFEKTGIHAQILRKSHNLWLQTFATDSWTLSEQNDKGAEMDESVQKDEVQDYHEQE
jgi:hypothetical protein